MSDPLPRRIAWFAPWTWFAHWKPWKRWILLAAATLIAYIELPIFRFSIIILDVYTGISIPRPIADGMYFTCVPLFWCMENCEMIDLFYDFQTDVVFFLIRSYFQNQSMTGVSPIPPL